MFDFYQRHELHAGRGLASLILAASVLALSGCLPSSGGDDTADDPGAPAPGDPPPGDVGTSYHDGDWARIDNLDPAGEGCVGCHGAGGFVDIAEEHNVGLHKNDTAQSLGVAGLEITGVTVDADAGQLQINVNQDLSALAADRNVRFTFAKLAPRVRHDRGHDWQNYLNQVRDRSDDEGSLLSYTPRPQPADRDEAMSWNNAGTTFTIDMSAMDNGAGGNQYDWGAHSFDVADVNGTSHSFSSIVGTRTDVPGLSGHVQCDAAAEESLQIPADGGQKLVCWWPDGTMLPSGTFVSSDDAFIVAYEGDYTHRVGLQIDGSPGFNTWFDFVGNSGAPVDADAYDVTTAGQADPASREVVTMASCNSCHDSLTRHGSNRSETQMCVTCHNPGNLEARSGRSVDLKQLVHRIHRGSNLPSNSHGVDLVFGDAADWTKVNFPQGPRPGSKEGVTNCVKCHMGAEGESKVSQLAASHGAGPGAHEALQLAEVTPQGDNWTNVRNINACQACHDDVYWDVDASDNPVDNFYRDYLGIADDEWRRSHRGVEPGDASGTTYLVGASNGFGCGSSGGCHDSGDPGEIASWDPATMGIGREEAPGFGPHINSVHLLLTRQALIGDRFETVIDDVSVDENGFTATIGVLDRQTGARLQNGDTVPGLEGGVDIDLRAFFGWMANGSPDYNHSTGDDRQPGSPTNSVDLTDGTWNPTLQGYDVALSWDDIGRSDWSDFDPATTVGTVAVERRIAFEGGVYSGAHLDDPDHPHSDGADHRAFVKSATRDFRFDGGTLAANEGRRMVVDFDQTCRSCHVDLRMHGSNRMNNPQVCVMCHNPNMTDVARAERHSGDSHGEGNKVVGEHDGLYEESEDFKRLVHAVHASGDGFRIDPIQARGNHRADASWPGVLDNCNTCHVDDSFVLDGLPNGMIGSTALTGDWGNDHLTLADTDIHDLSNHRKMSPIASVCTSCHDLGRGTADSHRQEDEDLPGATDGVVNWHEYEQGGRAPGAAPDGVWPSLLHQSNIIEP